MIKRSSFSLWLHPCSCPWQTKSPDSINMVLQQLNVYSVSPWQLHEASSWTHYTFYILWEEDLSFLWCMCVCVRARACVWYYLLLKGEMSEKVVVERLRSVDLRIPVTALVVFGGVLHCSLTHSLTHLQPCPAFLPVVSVGHGSTPKVTTYSGVWRLYVTPLWSQSWRQCSSNDTKYLLLQIK